MNKFLASALGLTGPLLHLRHTLEAHGLGNVWLALRYVMGIDVVLICLLPVLVWSHYQPARRESFELRRALLADLAYPVLTLLVASPLVGIGVLIITDTYRRVLPGANLHIDNVPFVIQFAIIFLVQDFLRWVSHFARHKIGWLWYFHAIHHSQTHLNSATTHRGHPMEGVIGTVFLALPSGVLGGSPVAWIYAGVTSLFWDMFIHSNIMTNLGPLGRVLVSPQYHRVHHSSLPEHFDRNFGDRILLWDFVFRTIVHDRSIYPPTGVGGAEYLAEVPPGSKGIVVTWIRQMVYPYRMIYRSIRGHAGRVRLRVLEHFRKQPRSALTRW